jgi:helicase MOV-10
MASARDFVICAFCNDVVRPASAFRAHLASDEHRERAEGNYVRCPVCKICLFPGNWTDHVSGASHRKNAERLGLRIHCDAEIPAAVPGRKRCNICKIFIPNDQWDAHLLGQHHAAKMRARDEVAGADAAIQRAKADKEGLSVSHLDGLDLGIVDIQNTDNYVRAELMVTTTSLDEQYELVGLKTKGLSGQGSASAYVDAFLYVCALTRPLRFTAERLGTSSVVHPLSGLSISVRFVPRANFIGRYAARVELLFVNSTEGTHFMIVRDVSATAGDQHAHETLAPTAPYVAPARNRFRKVRTQDVVSGERELRHNPYKIKLKQYPIPQDLETALEGGSSDVGEVIARLPDALRPRPLENAHYAAALQGQLWVEEYKAT